MPQCFVNECDGYALAKLRGVETSQAGSMGSSKGSSPTLPGLLPIY